MNSPKISRRTLLNGVGTAMALPFLDAMLPTSVLAQSATKAKRPLRMAFVFFPNGAHIPAWTPATDGVNYELPYILQPFKNVKDSLLVMTGLTQDKAFAGADGGGDHARSASVWLTGVHPKKTSGADIHVGISADQLAAKTVGRYTPFPSLEIGCERGLQAGNCDSGYSCAYSSCISWQTESTPVAKEVNPRAVFERFFANGDQDETQESRAKRDVYSKSVLDFVMDDANRLKSRLGAHDQEKLDEYFTGVRQIEQRVVRAETFNKQVVAGSLTPPTGIPHGYDEHIRLMADMMVLAFQTDLTRIATFMLSNEGSNRSFTQIGISEGHHELSHHMGNPVKQHKIREINHFQAMQVAYMLEKMQSIKEGDSTLLDNSMVVYGGGISDGNRHNHDDLPIILAGKGGGTIRTGRHTTYKDGTPMNNLLLSLLDRMGVHAETLGDSTGRLDQLI